MLSECKASAQQSTSFNQNFWSWYLNKECCIHSHSTMNHSPVQCHIVSVSILFSLSIEFCHSNALQSMECVFQQSIFSPCISNAQLFVDLCVCVCQNGKYFEFNSIFSAITITITNKQTDKRNMHYASVAFIVVTLNLVCKHLFDDSIVISFKIIRICIEI